MSGIGAISVSDSVFQLLKLMDSPKEFKDKLKQFNEAEARAQAAISKQDEMNREAAAKMEEANRTFAEGKAALIEAKELRDSLEGRRIAIDEREAKVLAKEQELETVDKQFAEWKRSTTIEIDQQRGIIKQRADSIIGQELELQSRKAEVDKLRKELEDKLQRMRDLVG